MEHNYLLGVSITNENYLKQTADAGLKALTRGSKHELELDYICLMDTETENL